MSKEVTKEDYQKFYIQWKYNGRGATLSEAVAQLCVHLVSQWHNHKQHRSQIDFVYNKSLDIYFLSIESNRGYYRFGIKENLTHKELIEVRKLLTKNLYIFVGSVGRKKDLFSRLTKKEKIVYSSWRRSDILVSVGEKRNAKKIIK